MDPSIMAHLQNQRDPLATVHDEKDPLTSSADLQQKGIDSESNLDFDPNSDAVKRVRWKIDKRLVPLLALMYLCSFLDRANSKLC